MSIALLLEVLAKGFSLLGTKEAKEWEEKRMELERDYYEEFNKGPGHRNNAVLDNIDRELCILAKAFASSPGAKDAGAGA